VKRFDRSAVCGKCGCPDIDNRWREALEGARFSAPAPEWISRKCKDCGYMWDELPLDAPE
jgi:hypothetical protein